MSEIKNVLYKKNGIQLIKQNQNNYTIEFQMENNQLSLLQIINFNLIKALIEINCDIYENFALNVTDDNTAELVLLLKHFYEDIGFPQFMACLSIRRIVADNNITCLITTTENIIDRIEQVEILKIKKAELFFVEIEKHKISCTINVEIENTQIITSTAEKFIGLFLHRIFLRVKQFIENIKV
jgi:hypothetical protein